jgi:hypothetical protein
VSVRQRHDRRWSFDTLPVAANGTFTAFLPLKRDAKIMAQWAGDDTHRGAGTGVLRVRVDPPPKKETKKGGGSAARRST